MKVPIVKSMNINDQSNLYRNIIAQITLTCMIEPDKKDFFIQKGLKFAKDHNLLVKIKMFGVMGQLMQDDPSWQRKWDSLCENEFNILSSLL